MYSCGSWNEKTVIEDKAIEGVVRPSVQRTVIEDSDIQRAAALHARIDLTKARGVGSIKQDGDQIYVNLRDSYSKLLRTPADPNFRLEVAVQQVNLGLATQALYHLKRAEDASGDHERALVALARSIAYQQLGNQQEATRHYEAAKQIDPKLGTPDTPRGIQNERLRIIGMDFLIVSPGKRFAPRDLNFVSHQ